MTRTLITGRIFTADPSVPWAEALIVEGDRISAVGRLADLADARVDARFDAGTGVVLPGFVDAHCHLLATGASLQKAQLAAAVTLDEIGAALVDWASANPAATRVLGAGWQYSSVPGGRPTASMLDEFVSDRPVYLEANDLHSSWVNTLALEELGIDHDTPDPIGGQIVRDATTGDATGHLLETASFELVWPLFARVSDETRDGYLHGVQRAYHEAGVTTAVDMALQEADREAIARAEAAGALTLRVVGHWLIRRTGDLIEELAQVDDAARHATAHCSDRFRIVGIKLLTDGTIDGCTAATIDPYADGSVAQPIWDEQSLTAVVRRADALGLQVAIHAIGDLAVRNAVNAIEAAIEQNPARERRHRIEHLEYVQEAEVARIGALGIVASMQPVHVDPAIMSNWVAMLGDHRVDRGFAWPEYTAAGSVLTFSTDTPTAPYEPLPNMYIAATRRSPTQPALAPHRADFAVSLQEAIAHATRDAAWASWLEQSVGTLRVGSSADLVVLDRDPFLAGEEELLTAKPMLTMVRGEVVMVNR